MHKSATRPRKRSPDTATCNAPSRIGWRSVVGAMRLRGPNYSPTSTASPSPSTCNALSATIDGAPVMNGGAGGGETPGVGVLLVRCTRANVRVGCTSHSTFGMPRLRARVGVARGETCTCNSTVAKKNLTRANARDRREPTRANARDTDGLQLPNGKMGLRAAMSHAS